jgi:hypothetical protein
MIPQESCQNDNSTVLQACLSETLCIRAKVSLPRTVLKPSRVNRAVKTNPKIKVGLYETTVKIRHQPRKQQRYRRFRKSSILIPYGSLFEIGEERGLSLAKRAFHSIQTVLRYTWIDFSNATLRKRSLMSEKRYMTVDKQLI